MNLFIEKVINVFFSKLSLQLIIQKTNSDADILWNLVMRWKHFFQNCKIAYCIVLRSKQRVLCIRLDYKYVFK